MEGFEAINSSRRAIYYVRIYIKNKLFLEVDSLSQRDILILNNFHMPSH
jgi:hypothetical protein